MRTLELIDESFDKDYCENYELSIQACLNGFSFAVKDVVRSSFVALVKTDSSISLMSDEDYAVALEALFEAYPWLKQRFKNVYFNFSEAPYTLVPKEIFVDTTAKTLLSLIHDVPNSYEIHYCDFATEPRSEVVFAMPSLLASNWVVVHPKTQFVAPIAQFNPQEIIAQNSFIVEGSNSSFTIALIKDGTVVAINTFPYKTSADVAYYILGFSRSLGVESKSEGIKIVGDFTNPEEVENLLKCYFASVSTDVLFKRALFTYRLMKYRSKFFGLFNQNSQCE